MEIGIYISMVVFSYLIMFVAEKVLVLSETGEPGEILIIYVFVPLIPIVNVIISGGMILLLVVFSWAPWLIDKAGDAKWAIEKRIRNKKEKKKQMGRKKKDPMLFYAKKLKETYGKGLSKSVKSMETKGEIALMLERALEKYEKNCKRQEFINVSAKYEEVFENILEATEITVKTHGEITRELEKEVWEIAKLFGDAVNAAEKSVLEKAMNKVRVEKELLSQK